MPRRETAVPAVEPSKPYWYEFQYTNGTVQHPQYRYTLAEFWSKYRATYKPAITLEGVIYEQPHPNVCRVTLCSEVMRLDVFPLPFAIGKTRRAELQYALDNAQEQCDGCSDYFDPDDLETITVSGESNDKRLCESCREEYYSCERCGNSVHSDDSVNVHVQNSRNGRSYDEIWCEDCADSHAFKCGDCGDYYSSNSFQITLHSGRDICHDCYSNGDYGTCESCGDVFDSEELHYSERSEEHHCNGCYDPSDDESEHVHDYGYKPRTIFHGGANQIHYGIELEVSADSDCAEDTLDLLGGTDESHVYLKEDSSIVGNGFEIVTHPHTLKAHRELWREFFLDRPSGYDKRSTAGNGMHVHIQRKYLTALQTQKMLVFMNAPENYDFIQTIADRDTTQWAKCKEHLAKLTACGNEDRYQALNLTNSKTVEVRIFRSTLDGSVFFKNLEFCDALVSFTRDRSYRDLGYKAFCSFVRANRKAYINLDSFLATKGYLAPIKARPQSIAA